MKDWKEKIKAFWKKRSTECLLVIGLTMLFTSWVMSCVRTNMDAERMEYADFLTALYAGDIDTVYYSPGNEYMTITLYNETTRDMPREELDTYEYPDEDKRQVLYPAYDEFRKDIIEAGANIQIVRRYDFETFFSNTLSFLVPLFFLGYMISMLRGQMRGVTEKDIIHNTDTKFTDVIGQDEIIEDLKFVTKLIKNPNIGDTLGAKPPKGLLLQGPPGTGKTLIAKAIAGEAGVPFIQQSASGFIEMYVGVGAKRVRDLFRIAKKNAPCIIFIDEIDAVGVNRDNNKGTSENEQTINALLEQMDGFTGREGVFVIAATNRADKLDPALVRPGRFDRWVTVNPPRDWLVRKEMFTHYLEKFTVADDVDIDGLSHQVSGFTGADIAAVCNEASIIAMMKDKTAIDMACIEEAIDKKVFKGNRSKRKQFEADRRIVAYHESGHAVCSWLLGEPISRASIQSTVSGVGGAVFNADKETLFSTNRDFKHKLLILYAGRVSEEIKFGDVTTGASNDITQATNLMMEYIERFGFDSSFGLIDMSVLTQNRVMNTEKLTDRLTKMSMDSYEKCKALLLGNYDKVEILATELLDKETLSGTVILDLLGDRPEVDENFLV